MSKSNISFILNKPQLSENIGACARAIKNFDFKKLVLIKNNKITTPPIETGALGGITRKTAIEIASSLGYETVEENITKEDLLNADELFFTGTATEVIGVVSVDGEDIGTGSPGSITNAVRNNYLEIVNGNNPISENYLTLVK